MKKIVELIKIAKQLKENNSTQENIINAGVVQNIKDYLTGKNKKVDEAIELLKNKKDYIVLSLLLDNANVYKVNLTDKQKKNIIDFLIKENHIEEATAVLMSKDGVSNKIVDYIFEKIQHSDNDLRILMMLGPYNINRYFQQKCFVFLLENKKVKILKKLLENGNLIPSQMIELRKARIF